MVGEARTPDPHTWLAQARVAMGGEALASVTSLTARGSHRRTIASMAIDSSWEMSWQSPDKFLQVEVRTMDRGPMGSRTITEREGYNGSDSIFEVISPDMPGPLFFPADPRSLTPQEKAEMEARTLALRKQSMIRLLVPLLASADVASATYPLTLVAGDPATLADRPTNVIVVMGPDGASGGEVMRLFLDAATHLPAMVTWSGRPVVVTSSSAIVRVPQGGRMPPGQPMPPQLPAGDPTAGQPDVEYRMVFGDYRADKGITWPRRLTTTVGTTPFEDIRVSRYTVNPNINARTFAVKR